MSAASAFAFISAFCAGGLAIAAATQARRSPARWAFALGMAVLAAESVLIGLGAGERDPALARTWQERRLVALAFVPVAWLWFSATYARGNARQFLRQTRVLLIASALLPAGLLVFRAHALLPIAGDAAPATFFRLGWAGMVLCGFVLLASVLVVMNLERTFRAAVGTIRWRIKFMLLGVGVLFVTRLFTGSQALVFRAIDPALDSINAGALILAAVLMLRSFFRAGHFDLDVYPSQSVLQNSVTVLLAGVYLLIIGALAKAVTHYGGDDAFALKAFIVLVALVGLAVVLQSDHARLQLRRFVSHHFQRPLHDYRTVWQRFTDATATRIEQRDLSRAVAALVADVFQALSVSVWLLNEKNDALQLAASTSARGGPVNGAAAPADFAAADVLAHFRAHPEPADIELDARPWAAALRERHPGVFPHGGHRVAVPLVNRGEPIGVITIGDRVGGLPFSLQDFELLKCAADHAAASLMNVQLAEKLLHARELEAFQAMAAFFVHDLKNAASTLKLTLQNLPVHFDDPEFRADALRGIGKTVTHINRLIGGLSALRHELKVELAEADLNEVVEQALGAWEHAAGPRLERAIAPLPRIPLDREQFNKVVTNLVLNAAEASPRDGHVRIATRQESDWVVLSVSDDGCGMTEEFLHKSLFRPFQTTKTNGLGIGMFQSKMIVEAHGGRMTVKSQPGRGTTFDVHLRARR